MRKRNLIASLLLASQVFTRAAGLSLETAPPVVVRTVPVAGSVTVRPGPAEIHVTFSKPMAQGSWSWCRATQGVFPERTGEPLYLEGARTCVLPVTLKPATLYAIWLNYGEAMNFRDTLGQSAIPYLLTFRTEGDPALPVASAPSTPTFTPAPGELNDNQKAVLAWTDRQFRSYFDDRSFASLSAEERSQLEARLIDTLKGPQSREYFQAISTLGALRSTNALPALRGIAFDRADKNNRDRWMAIRTLGFIGQPSDIPELIHLVYHGNVNTRWWAQISLVRLTGKNFAGDWEAWGKWWNSQNGQPPFNPEIIKWWSGQSAPENLASALLESDETFFTKSLGMTLNK